MIRPPDWLIYGAVIAVVAGVSLARRQDAAAPPAPPEASEDELGAFLGPVTPFDPRVVVDAPDGPFQPAMGTAFAVGGEGHWLTARHVVEGCRRPALVVGGGRAVAADLRLSPRSDTALLITEGGPDPLPARAERLRIGQRAYHPGFPQGSPGETASRLLGRETLRIRGRGARDEAVLAWAEIGRTDGLTGALSGLSGAPALDDQGRVVAVTIAEAPRRGRIYTTDPATLEAVLAEAGGDPAYAPGAVLTRDNYGRVADSLRRDLRVAQVVCLQG